MPQSVQILAVILSQVQDSTLALVKPHLVYCCLTLQSVQILLNGSTAFCCVTHSSQLCIIVKLAEGTLSSFIQVIDDDVEQDPTQYQPLWDTSNYRSPTKQSRLSEDTKHAHSKTQSPLGTVSNLRGQIKGLVDL